ncbi:MAG: TIGR00289 family protein, partial [bacterium]|nr:TIGR00289 family protein [bacterium]
LIEIKKKLHININGEGGEYETFVINGPMFKKRVIITDAEIHMEKRFSGTYSIKNAYLASN